MNKSKNRKHRQGLFIIGVTILLIGATAVIFIPFWGILGIPFYLLGAVIVLFSQATWRRKASYILLPVLAFFAYQPIEYFINKGEATTYLIPEGYTGSVRVAFDQTSAQLLEYEGGRRIFRINEDGILVTQAVRGSGYLDERFYYLSPTGERTRLSIIDRRRCRYGLINDRSSVGVFRGGSITRSGPTQFLPDTLKFTYFTVASCETQHQFSRQTIEPSRQDTLLVRAIWGEDQP